MSEGAVQAPKAWSSAFMVAAAGLFANVLNLGVSVLIARLLNPVQYGAYSQMLGIFFIVALPGSALSVAVVRRATWYLVRDDEALVQRWQRRLNQRILRMAGYFSLVALAVSFALAYWLGHRSWIAVWLITLAAISWAVLNVDRALIQARQRYGALAANLALEGITRTIFMVLFSPLGVTGIAAGLFIAIVCARLHARALIRPRRVIDGPTLEHTGVTTDLVVALSSLAVLAVLQFADVFLVGHYQNQVAGPYSAISQVAKTVVYAAIILGGFLLPEAALAERQGRAALRPLVIAGVLLALPAGVMLAFSALWGHGMLEVVFGARYASQSGSLVGLVVAMTLLAASTLMITFHLGLGRRLPSAWLVLTTLGGLWYLNQSHGLPHELVNRNIALQAIVLCGLIFLAVPSLHRSKANR